MTKAVSIILRTEDYRVFVSERTGQDADNFNGLLQVVGGKVEIREEPRSAAVREILEEIGLHVSSGCLQPLGVQRHRKPSGLPYLTHLFTATVPDFLVPEHKEPDRSTPWRAVHVTELLRIPEDRFLPGLHAALASMCRQTGRATLV